MISDTIYRIMYAVFRVVMFFWHPVFRIHGRENAPREGRLVICGNHSGMADPIWIILALKPKHMPCVLAKKELFSVPVLSWFLKKIGVIGVDRDNADVTAVKAGLRVLRDDKQLMIFPEGTRVRNGVRPTPKRGALTLAARTDAPILPIYLSTKRYPFSPLDCVIGKPVCVEYQGKRATDVELESATQKLMDQIYEMGENL